MLSILGCTQQSIASWSRGDLSASVSFGEASLGALCLDVESSGRERHSAGGAHPEDKNVGTPLL